MKKNIRDIIDTHEFTKTFLEQFKGDFKIEKRFDACKESIEVKARIFKTYDYFVDLEFASEEDAKLFYDNQDKVINLIILP